MGAKKLAPIEIRAVSIQYSMKINSVYFKFFAKAYHSLLKPFWYSSKGCFPYFPSPK